MNQNKWQKAKELFHEAQALPPDERIAFLDKACDDDLELREQIENLLGSYESGFMEEPVLNNVIEAVGAENEFNEGQVIGRYRLNELIGSGGMGEVFLADDTELNRPVAFKVLHAEVAEDKDRIRRFIQEARAASALNHPNILTIHEIGTHENSRFIVSEYVQGETLRERLNKRPPTIAESIEIAEQIAAALRAAHEAGIVHRDIKPENIMLRKDGLVKILDFGLAKLSEPPASASGERDATLTTAPGIVMGTVAYMSPEQARGVKTDARTDLWSLGVVLYEMLSGKLPFPGDTTSDIIASILKTDVEPIDNLNEEISRDLESICFRSLEKDVSNRYPTADAFRLDLQRAKKNMEDKTSARSFDYADEKNTEIIRHRPTVTIEFVKRNFKQYRPVAIGFLALLGSFGLGLGIYKFASASETIVSPFVAPQKLNIAPLVTIGKPVEITLSPDGKFAAYVIRDGEGDDEKYSIRLRQIATSSDVEIVPLSEPRIRDLSFTPDSNHLYYVHKDILFRSPTLGGPATKIAGLLDKYTYVSSDAGVSPDGKMIAFSREDEELGTSFLQIANADGTDERTLVKFSEERSRLWAEDSPWSPDGATVGYGVGAIDKDGMSIRIFGINVADGTQRQLSMDVWTEITGMVWLSDGNLIISGKEKSRNPADPSQLWLIGPNTRAQPITNERFGYSDVSATANGDALLAIQTKMPRDLWVIPENDATRAKQVTTSGEVVGGIDWMPDGNLLLGSNASGNRDIWSINADGTNRRQLTTDPGSDSFASITSDGRYIVFSSSRVDSILRTFRMNADGSDQKQLTNGSIRDFNPRLSLDGKWVYYIQETPGTEPNQIWKISIDGGEPIKVADIRMPSAIAVSPRTGMIAYVNSEDRRKGGVSKIIILSPDGEKAIKTLWLPRTAPGGFIQWTPDERSIAFNDSRNRWANIWTISVDGKGEAKPLTNFTTEQTLNFDWSPNGKQLVVSRGTQTSEAVLIRSDTNSAK